ncbi:Elongation factor Tu GTP-binding domain-containing protein 1 [Trichinella pseudospiralis]|uniref:Ribosome assembly protein 1 n=1 Tax=Trichinella pseudospiralis TaxID=6337 RepID=A0A0V1IIE6_TRIPS|nr:Elongation factor Tu GTP-binding domain-containing protein 1 [Trichinella pseudospiralis]
MHFLQLVAKKNYANICAIFRISWPNLKLINIRKNCTVKSSAGYFYFHDLLQWTDESQLNIRDNLLFLPNFINEHEEQLLIDEVQRRLKTMRYENTHWDDAIVNYREIEKSTWEDENAKIIEKIRRTAFTADADHQDRVHVLDLEKTGWIKPHVDSIRYCGDVVAGLCLLSDAVMRFRSVENNNQIVDLLVERRGLYIMRGFARYEFTHEILKNGESFCHGVVQPVRMAIRNRQEFVKHILKLQSTPEFVRNVCIMAHVDHGKTTLADSLISANGIISQKMVGTLRYMDSLPEEQQRGITMKSSSISLFYGNEHDSFLINIVDSPGHVDFSGELCAAAVLCDGAVVVIDVIEGVCPQTSASLRLAWKEGLKPCLVLNKIDRLFVEYRMSPMDAYRRLVQVLEQANAVAGELFVSREIEKEDFLSRRRRSMSRSSLRKSESGDEMLYFMPETGNVVFASALDNWGFRLRDFARFWSKRLHTDEELLLQSLWGDYYIDSKTKLPVFGASDKGKSPLFVVMILNNLSAIYDSMIINVEKGRIEKILNSLQLDVISKEFTKSDSRQRLQIVMSRWLPLAESVLGMVCEWLPSPKHLDNDRIERIMCGDRFAHCDYLEPKARAMKALFKQCSMEASCATTVFISKMIAVEQDLLRGKNKFMLPNSVECNYWLQAAERRSCCEVESFHSDIDEITDEMAASTSQCVFLGFARIFTGNLCSGDVLYWIPDYAMIQSGNATFREITIGQLYVMMGREFEAVQQVCAGNLVCIGGVQDLVARTATLSTDLNCPPLCDSGFYAKPIVQVSVEPRNTRDLPALIRGLKMLNLADGCVQALVEDSGEHVLTAVGEIHLHRCIKDLCDRFAKGIDLIVSDPVVPFNETIVSPVTLGMDSANEMMTTTTTTTTTATTTMSTTTTTASTQSEKVDRSITVTTAGRTVTIVAEAVPLPEPIQQILEENEPLIAMIDPVTNRIDVTGNTAGRLASIRDGFDHIREELLDVCSNLGKQWSNIVQRLWAFGPRRAVVNLLLNDIDDYRRPNFFDILLDQHFDSKTGLRQYDQSIVAGFHVCCRAGPICEEPIRGVAFLVKCWDSVDGVDSMESIFGPLSGQLIVAMKEGCREAFQAQPQRLMLPMYTCIIQATGDVLGRVYSVLHRRSGKVINEKMKEGTNLFEVVASIPVVECFGFADDLRKRASGLAWPQLVFSHWEVLAMDPFWLPTTDDEIMHHGEKGEWENSAMRYVNMIRKRKGLSVNEKIVEHAEKQRNLAKKHAVSSCGCDATWLGLTVQCCQGSTVSTAFRQMPRVRHASLYTATGLERWVGAEHVLLLGKTVLLQPVCRSNDHHNNNPLNISKCSFSFAFLALFNNSTVLVCSLVVVQFFFWVGRGKIVSAQLCPFVHETEEESVHIAVPYLLLIRYSNNSMSVRVDNFCLKTIIFICKSIFLANAFLDNDVIKEPAVVCDHDRIMFTFETKNPFTGHVFVKGKYDDPNCRRDFLNNESNGATVSIRIPQCGMRRIRQLQPQATSYSVTFIVNFHPEFITKFDKAFNVRCFYSQQDKIVTAQLEVSMVPTQFLDSTTTLTPNCQYSVRAGSVNGPVVRYIKVGDVLVHRWDCDNPDFGMLVKNCYVSDGVERSVRILDETGCPTFSPGIQGNLNYDATLNTASVKVWAYKFPDRADLFFQCQIQICNKQSNECAAITPPHCPAASESNWTESQLSTTTTSESVTYVIGSFEQPENEKMEMPQLPGYGRRSRAVDLHRPSAIELDNLTRRLHSALKEAGFVASKAADNLTTSNSKRFPSEKDQKDFRKENDVTFSVATDMVYIADKDDANNYPFESTEKTSATCFSRTAFAMLFYSYTMLIIVVLLLTCKLCGFLNACLKRRINSKTAHQQS